MALENKIARDKTIDYLNKHFNNYYTLFEETQHNIAIYNLIKFMDSSLSSKEWIATLLAYYDKFKEENLLEFLKKLDNKFSADLINSETPGYRLAANYNIIKAIENYKSSAELLQDACFTYNKDALFYILEGDMYHNRHCRYILKKLDLICGGLNSKSDAISYLLKPQKISIEHILPQAPTENSKWYQDFSTEEIEHWLHKLGNLTLVSLYKNSELRNDDYTNKKQKFLAKNINMYPNTVYIFSKNNSWTLNDLNNNHERVLKLLKEHYV